MQAIVGRPEVWERIGPQGISDTRGPVKSRPYPAPRQSLDKYVIAGATVAPTYFALGLALSFPVVWVLSYWIPSFTCTIACFTNDTAFDR